MALTMVLVWDGMMVEMMGLMMVVMMDSVMV
jgi:hypothetical protein